MQRSYLLELTRTSSISGESGVNILEVMWSSITDNLKFRDENDKSKESIFLLNKKSKRWQVNFELLFVSRQFRLLLCIPGGSGENDDV